MKKLKKWSKYIGECLFALFLPWAYDSWTTFKIKSVNKAFLEILIHEIQECKNMEEVNVLLNSWIKANDLHPENVETLTDEGFRQRFSTKGRTRCTL